MNRRDFFTTSGLLVGTTYMSACGSTNDTPSQSSEIAEATQPKPTGAVTLYYEFKIAGPEIASMMTNMATLASDMDAKAGFLNMTLKQLVGDSTMVNNFTTDLKGVLKSAYFDAAAAGRRPFLYTLLLRFDNYDNLIASGAKEWFLANIEPQLFAYNGATTPPTKTPIVLDFFQGIYQTVAAGDADGVYTEQADIATFLQNQKDVASASYQAIPADGTTTGVSVSVKNHVTVYDNDVTAVNTGATALLAVAQQTYQPSTNATDGTPGTLTDSNYQKAVTTEILQNAYYSGDTRDYLFHGVWKSVADHENSHVDARFMQAAGPVGAFVIAGPSEPFYQTMMLHNKATA